MTGPPIARSFDGFAGHTARAKESLRAAPHDADPTPGPTTAFEAAYAEHFGFVWRSLRGLGVPTASLDDAAQDVFVVVHDRLHTFDSTRPMRAWLFGIVRNVARRHHERGARQSPLQLVQSPAPLEETMQWRERAAVVAAMLEQLDEGHRAVFLLAQLEGATAPEIADALGINLNTVYSRLRTARARFERAVARHERRDTESTR